MAIVDGGRRSPTAAYNAAAKRFSKEVQWLVEIDLDRCAEVYTQVACTAADAGDNARCWYSFLTCQDPANYNKTTKTYYFCLNTQPWLIPATQAWPLLSNIVTIPQEVKSRKLFVWPEEVKITMMLDALPPAPDHDKGDGFYNTTKVGEFFHNLFTRNRNYPQRAVRIKRGFADPAMGLSDFLRVGPEYLLKEVNFTTDTCMITAESPLAKLNRSKAPWKVSTGNVITDSGGINAAVTTVNMSDGAEFPDPADYSRNTIYIEIESEICVVSSITANALTIIRGQNGTTAATHAEGVQVSHMCIFGTDNGTSAATVRNIIEVLQDLMEWAGVASGDVDTATFNKVKAGVWPSTDVLRELRQPKTCAKMLQELKENRSIIIFLDELGKWNCDAMVPDAASDTITDDHIVSNTLRYTEDEEERYTRVTIWYAPSVDDPGKEPKNYSKGVQSINATLEGANYFGASKEKEIVDPWLDTNTLKAKVHVQGRRVLALAKFGLREVKFQVEVKDGEYNVGDQVFISSREITDIYGNYDIRPIYIMGRKEVGRSAIEYRGRDMNYGSGRLFKIGPDTMADDYDSATDTDKQYGYWGDSDNRVGDSFEDGYYYW